MKTITKRIIRNRDHADILRDESALVGSVVIDATMFDRLDRVTGDSFFEKRFGKLFDLLRTRYENGLPNDIVLVNRELHTAGISITTAELAEIFTGVPSQAHARHYAGNVSEAARLRKLIELADSVTELANDATKASFEIVETISREIDEMHFDESAKVVTIAEAGKKLLAEIDQSKDKRRSATTGLWTLDSTLGGLMPGEMIVVAARPGIGKTSFAMQVAMHNANHKRKALFVSLEMRSEELAGRVFGGLAEVPTEDIRAGNLTPEQRQRLVAAIEYMAEQPLLVFDPATATMRDIRATARAQNDLSLIVIDYLSLIAPTDNKQQRWEQVSEISRSIKRLAKELKVPILALQQLSRDADGNRPKLSNLRESGSIEQDADSVLFIHRDQSGQTAANNIDVEIIIAKNRHGRDGNGKFVFEKEQTRFNEAIRS